MPAWGHSSIPGQYLTAINYQRPVTEQPDPFGDVRKGAPLDRCARSRLKTRPDRNAARRGQGTDADAALQAGTMTPQRAVHIITHVAKALDTSPTLTTLCIVRFTSDLSPRPGAALAPASAPTSSKNAATVYTGIYPPPTRWLHVPVGRHITPRQHPIVKGIGIFHR